ncbi:MAG: non-hydrolyzing UDP-N-acetylglucosamine 2-epimerase, partial [Desulfobaccales bacterium]
MKVFLVAGARPNFMKIAPLYRAAQKYEKVVCKIVHTGQHYDFEMSQAFFHDLDLPEPDFYLNAGSGTHAAQTAKIMVAFEEICLEDPSDWVVVVGDVNSTMACSIVAKKYLLKVAHVEAGLRSFDLSMPEEINRIVTDAIADLFFVTEESAVRNLLREGKQADQIHLVGNVMIDNLFYQREKLKIENVRQFSTFSLKARRNAYLFLTLHRPSNVDDEETFRGIAWALNRIAEDCAIFFPVHPRTKKMMAKFGIQLSSNIEQLPPLGFREALFLWQDAEVVLTDSGGLQEETTALGIPCITIRENTERPITLEMGSNILAGTRPEGILKAYREARARGRRES